MSADWISNGVRGLGDKPALAGAYAGRRAIVAGAGRCLWSDLAQYGADKQPPRDLDVIAINHTGLFLTYPFKHWASVHADLLVHLRAARRTAYLSEPPALLHAPEPLPGIDHVWRFESDCFSGAFAALLALALGYEPPVLLAGIPDDDNGHFYTAPGHNDCAMRWQARSFWRWLDANAFHGRVEAMSGNTKTWLDECRAERRAA